jgi:D-alanine-D-alanine ligase
LNRAEALGFPLFVKPCRAGSSLGISKVGGVEELGDGILQAGEHDPRVLLEAAVPGREIECAVLGAVPPAPARASLPSEIVVRGGHEFYDFEAKYLDAAGAELRCPADLPPGVAGEVQAMACAAFSAIGAEGLARVDFFYDEAGPPGAQLIINEINTMPGFTPISQYPRMWQATGLEYTELLSELIDLTLARRVGLR